MAGYSSTLSFMFGVVLTTFIIRAVYQCIQLVFYKIEHPETE